MLACRALRNRGYDEFTPRYLEKRRWSDRVKEFEMPLFPGYLFCRFDLAQRMSVLSSPGVLGIVSFGGVPAPVDDTEVSHLKILTGSGKNPQPWPYLTEGERIRIGSGPLTGMEGIVIQLKNQYRLIASVTLLQRSVAVEIDSDSATAISASGRLKTGISVE
ncbi:MAG: hypothetical protein M3Y27_03895 [Acidobacteriota bacterium]|nr:hypothetical protein [Acidobacteriota bacterium]